MLNTIHIDASGKTARVLFQSLPPALPRPKPRLLTASGEVVTFRVSNGVAAIPHSQLTFDDLQKADPEIESGRGGEILDPDQLSTAYFDPADGKPARDFREIDIVYDASGAEKERRPHVRRASNVNDIHPLKTGKRMPTASALTSFVFKQILQLVHEDGLTHDFLFGIARDLHQSGEMMLLGAGPKGNQPLVIRDRGTPYRAFLYGETGAGDDAGKYKLLLLLTDQELKRPSETAAEESGQQ